MKGVRTPLGPAPESTLVVRTRCRTPENRPGDNPLTRPIGAPKEAYVADRLDVAELRTALGKQLALSRRAAGLSQHQLAPLVHYGRSTIANVEVGRQNVPRSFWERCDEELQANGTLLAGYEQLRMTTYVAQQAAGDLRLRVVAGLRVTCLQGRNGNRPWGWTPAG
jgi:hypothetical protein